MAAVDETEGLIGLVLMIGLIGILIWAASKFGLFGSSSDSGASPSSSTVFTAPVVNGVTGVSAVLQRGIAGLVGGTPDQVFGPNATGPGSPSWWNNFWSWLLPWGRPYNGGSVAPIRAFTPDQIASSANGAPDQSIFSYDPGVTPDRSTQNLLDYLGAQA